MAQFYTLEEAARVLGMSAEDLKSKAQQREVRAFMDSGSWRFRVADVDELARRRGMGSDPDLSLSDLDLEVPGGSGSGSDEADMLSEFQLGAVGPDLAPPSVVAQVTGDQDVLLDDLSVPPESMSKSSSTIIGMKNMGGKSPSDSDVRLVPEATGGPKSASDSDVRLAPSASRSGDSDVTLISDASLEIPNLGGTPSSASSDEARGKKGGAGFGTSGEVAAAGDEQDSDFELTPSSVIDALQPESGSDFELTALDASDEFESTPRRGPSDSDVTGVEPSASGINLGRPSDSGINLQAVSGFNIDKGESIELAPLGSGAIDLEARGSRDDLSGTSLPVKAEKDIFEDTDFEVDALDSEDRTMQMEAASDFDVDDSDSASEVFAIDEEEVDTNAATAMAPAPLGTDFDEEEGEGVSGETPAAAWDVEGEESPSMAARMAASPMLAGRGADQAEWGGVWVGVLGVTTVVMLLLAFVGMDLVRNMYDFHEGSPASGLVKSISGMMGG